MWSGDCVSTSSLSTGPLGLFVSHVQRPSEHCTGLVGLQDHVLLTLLHAKGGDTSLLQSAHTMLDKPFIKQSLPN